MQDTKNLILAIALSVAVLVGWQYYFGMPLLETKKQSDIVAKLPDQAQQQAQGTNATAALPATSAAGTFASREEALAASPRVIIDTPKLKGSLSLKGGDIDDVAFKAYRETVDPTSPNIVLFSPDRTPDAYFARFFWLAAPGTKIELPSSSTIWTANGTALTEKQPLALTWDNGQGFLFKREIAVDDGYMFTVTDTVTVTGSTEATLIPYGGIERFNKPKVVGTYVLHEGFVGFIGEQGLAELTYDKADKADPVPGASGKGTQYKTATGGFAGITDKYWAAALVPDQATPYDAVFRSIDGPTKIYQVDMTQPALTVAAGASVTSTKRLFVGAKEVKTVDGYTDTLGIKRFDLLIDWGWFYFFTKPLFKMMEFFFHWTGNFGFAILIVTVLVKAAFFPLASKSYASMAKMKAVQPQMAAIKERFPEDKVKQQQELMELYKKEKINPIAGCWPMLIQIPVFFSLYKVLYVTIEMRHAPFIGWIHDLASPDPTSVFTLFGLIPWTPPTMLMIGIWPLIMGVTMFVQMKMNPAPPDPVQQAMFSWMPVMFTFMLGSFPAGLVIYWSWNNTLSVSQQYLIMRRHGVKVELWDNLGKTFGGLLRKKS
ncbi:MAG: membrane protein insertase YidC [Beijerinckiaceae bacterium]|nr:membrane protein insertase YidC [Beijerinckiaceae bacterium]